MSLNLNDLKNFKVKVESGDKKAFEFKGPSSILILGIVAIIALVLFKVVFVGTIVSLIGLISFIFSPLGLFLLALVAGYIAVDTGRRERFLKIVRCSKKKAEDKIKEFDLEDDKF